MTEILLFGGWKEKKSVYSYSPASKQWKKLPDLPSDRASHQSIAIDRHIYLVGGDKNKTIDRYDPVNKTVSTVASMESPIFSFGMCLYKGNQIIVAGGCTDQNDVSNSTFLFDTTTNSFKEVGKMTSGRRAFVLVNCCNTVYAIGGFSTEYDYLRSIEEFDPITESWKKVKAKMKVARSSHQAVAHKHFIYVFGGKKKVFGSARVLDSIEKINTKTNYVELLTVKLEWPRMQFAAASKSSQVFLFGGHFSYYLTKTFEVFDLEQENILEGKDVPTENNDFTACVFQRNSFS